MGAIGAFTFVLHTHLPYARLAGRWPHGEEWIHEAATETYIPLLQTLYDLKNDGVPFRLTLGITPVLAEQLTDSTVLEHFDLYLNDRIEAARRDIEFFSDNDLADSSPDPHLRYLAAWYKDRYEAVQRAFRERFNRDIIGAFRRLQDDGYIEILTSAATHGYLPLLSRDSSIVAQLQAGLQSYERCFGRRPTGFWLPECAYRPAYVTDDGRMRPGLETWLARHGLKVFFSETHTITGGLPVGVAAGDVLGPYGAIKRHYVIPGWQKPPPERPATTFVPYYVRETAAGAEADKHAGVAVIGRNNRTGMQVWSSDWGYPGDFDYREFHRKAGTSGLQYWRVTGAKIDLAAKDYYRPDWAAAKVDQHAEDFAHLVGDLLRNYHRETGQVGLIASAYDTELFGHWWFEGVVWLGKVLRLLASNSEVELTTASDHISRHPPADVLDIPESSWGAGGGHFTWDNADTHWMWPPIHEAERRMERLVAAFPDARGDALAALNQTARELLLLQSSDWPFLVTTGQAREYAIGRFNQHAERFDRLAGSLERGAPNRALADEYWELDRVFPDVDYHWFAEIT